MQLFERETIVQAWLAACVHLRETHDWYDTTLLLKCDTPEIVGAEGRAVLRSLDTHLKEYGRFSTHTVAETIFPGAEYRRNGVDGVFEHYPNVIFPRIRKHSKVNWGTYAYRMLRRTGKDGVTYNPIERMIGKMKQKQPVRAAYELDVGLDLSTYVDQLDGGPRMGQPCLSHLSFKLIKNSIHLTAVYRFHYYIEKALGNLLGLARLQSFVAKEVGANVGPLVCHSTLAELDVGKKTGEKPWGKRRVRSLLASCEELLSS